MVGAVGFEPTTSWSRTKRATKLRYAPTIFIIKHLQVSCLPSAKENRHPPESSAVYYALMKKRRKQFRRLLKTS